MPRMDEATARRRASTKLIGARAQVTMALSDLYDYAPGYAGEVEAVKEAIDNAMRVLSGLAPE